MTNPPDHDAPHTEPQVVKFKTKIEQLLRQKATQLLACLFCFISHHVYQDNIYYINITWWKMLHKSAFSKHFDPHQVKKPKD